MKKYRVTHYTDYYNLNSLYELQEIKHFLLIPYWKTVNRSTDRRSALGWSRYYKCDIVLKK